MSRSDHDHRNKAAAGVAPVGLAALLAMSASKPKQAQVQDEVSTWALGSFSGYDEGVEVEFVQTFWACRAIRVLTALSPRLSGPA